MPAVQLTMHVKSSTLYGRTVVQSYIQIFSAWWVTTILYNYGAKLCKLHYNQNVTDAFQGLFFFSEYDYVLPPPWIAF